jgi:hypothetical protein
MKHRRTSPLYQYQTRNLFLRSLSFLLFNFPAPVRPHVSHDKYTLNNAILTIIFPTSPPLTFVISETYNFSRLSFAYRAVTALPLPSEGRGLGEGCSLHHINSLKITLPTHVISEAYNFFYPSRANKLRLHGIAATSQPRQMLRSLSSFWFNFRNSTERRQITLATPVISETYDFFSPLKRRHS